MNKHSKTLVVLGTVILTLLLSACGSPATPEVIGPTATPMAFQYTCGAMRFATEYPCNANIATIKASDDTTVYIHTEASYIADRYEAPITFDAQIVDKEGNYMSYAFCTWDGNMYQNPTKNVALNDVMDTEYHSIKCYDNNMNKTLYVEGIFVVPVKSSLIMTLTAIAEATQTPTATATPGK